MITFQKFYESQTTNAHINDKNMHSVNDAYNIRGNAFDKVGDNLHSKRKKMPAITGRIIVQPSSNLFKGNLSGSRNIFAALGVEEARTGNKAKIYAFHLAKHKIATPGPKANDARDYNFFIKTLNSTANLAENVIGSNQNTTVLAIDSTNDFNLGVLKILKQKMPHLNLGDLNDVKIHKYTYNEAFNDSENTVIPSTYEGILSKCILKTHQANIKGKLAAGLILFLKCNQQFMRDSINDKISLDKLSGIMAEVCNNNKNAIEAELGRRIRSRDELAKIVAELNKSYNNGHNKAWFQDTLASIYFKPLANNIKLTNDIIIVDDNINSKSTYDATNIIVTRAANNIGIKPSIRWVVGIIPLN